MKKNAWTLAELSIIIIVILILTKVSMSITKNINMNKSRIFVYAAIRNLTMGNISINNSNGRVFYPTAAATHDTNNTTDWYCLQLADSFSIEGTANCSDTLNATTINFTLGNGISLMGVSSAWQTAYGDLDYKNITIDIDGSSGVNKLGVDRFPLRVFKGKNLNNLHVDGLVLPVDCGGDKLCNASGTCTTLSHPACGSNTNKMASNGEFISYGLYRVTDSTKRNTAYPILVGKSAIEADCLALGSEGFYGARICNEKGFDLHPKCAHVDTCVKCSGSNGSYAYNVCPSGGSITTCNTAATSNLITLPSGSKQGFKCFTQITKPTGGMGLMGGVIMGDVEI